MTLTQIKELRDTFKGKPNIVIDIYLDNDIVIQQGVKTYVVLWDDSKERLTCIRPSNRINQHEQPFEIMVTGYEHIQSMYVTGGLDDVNEYLKSINYNKTNNLLNYLSTLDINSASIAGSTGDGIDWNTRNPLDKQ